jgi:uncharacterized membrane protein
MSDNGDFSLLMDTKRLETLVDGIFAIAMTLLVLSLAVPQIPAPVSEAALQKSILAIVPNLISMVVSFVLLAVFWKIHHKFFKRITYIDGTLLWINVIWLLFIVLVPFSASLTGDYGDLVTSHIIFNLNMLGISTLLFLNWHYAKNHNFIHEKVGKKYIDVTWRVNVAFILIVIVAMILSFIIPQYSSIVYLITIPLEYIVRTLSGV